MKVLSISTDRKLFLEGSAVLERSLLYASKVEELHIVVFTLKKDECVAKQIGNLHLYPTNSFSQWLYITNAYSLSTKIIRINKLTPSSTVISTQDPFLTGLVGRKLAQIFSLPLQIQIHTDFLSPFFSKTLLGKIRKKIALSVIPCAKGIRVVNTTIKTSIENTLPSLKIIPQVLPIFVDIQKIIDTPPKTDLQVQFPQFNFIILMASRLTKEKRIDVALYALQKLVVSFPYVGLVVAGDGPERRRLEHLAVDLNLVHNVVFVGWQDDLISYYKTANIFLLTSEYEGYGMTLIEAAASNCPIVTARVGLAATDLFVDGVNACVCPVGDVSCLALAIQELISDNAKRELFNHSMQDSIRNIAQNQEDYTAKYIALLEGLL